MSAPQMRQARAFAFAALLPLPLPMPPIYDFRQYARASDATMPPESPLLDYLP